MLQNSQSPDARRLGNADASTRLTSAITRELEAVRVGRMILNYLVGMSSDSSSELHPLHVDLLEVLVVDVSVSHYFSSYLLV